jgi:hypothetical protein
VVQRVPVHASGLEEVQLLEELIERTEADREDGDGAGEDV